jgi:hypothetical protein
LGETAARHTSAEFVAFLTDIVVNQPRGKESHVIADNLSAPQDRAGEGIPCDASEGFICTSLRPTHPGSTKSSFGSRSSSETSSLEACYFRARSEEKTHALHP